jgi:hypothetical protein
VGLSAGLDDMEKRKFLTLKELELQPLGRPARSQSLYQLRYYYLLYLMMLYQLHILCSIREYHVSLYPQCNLGPDLIISWVILPSPLHVLKQLNDVVYFNQSSLIIRPYFSAIISVTA